MGKDLVIRGNESTALAAKLCRPHVIPAFPITPSTLFPEKISEYIHNGELDAELVLVESEHSAMSAAIGASAAGARVCTATASQGLKLMSEMLFIASGMRLPIVMAIGNRALSAPINIWCDHSDTIAERDSGWIQFYAEKNQEGLDLMIMAFKIAEDHRVLLPAMVGIDAFYLTHTMEAVDVPSQEEVDEFLPPYKPVYTLNPNKPMTFGSFGTPEYYMEFKREQERAMDAARVVIDEVFDEFYNKFGRRYMKVVPFMTEDADIIIVSMGSMTGTVRATVKKLRQRGEKVGLLKLTVYRPFPFKEIFEYTKNAKVIAVMDRSYSFGFAGAVYSEFATTFINKETRPLMLNFIVGLGGRDVTPEQIERIYAISKDAMDKNKVEDPVHWIGLHDYEVVME